jgi:hypothetical protein
LLDRLVASTGANELMVTTSTFAHADRLASYEQRASALLGVVPAVLPELVGHAGSPGQTAHLRQRAILAGVDKRGTGGQRHRGGVCIGEEV